MTGSSFEDRATRHDPMLHPGEKPPLIIAKTALPCPDTNPREFIGGYLEGRARADPSEPHGVAPPLSKTNDRDRLTAGVSQQTG